jgi:putative intracellular protease/amidase
MSQSPAVADHHMRVDLFSTRPKQVLIAFAVRDGRLITGQQQYSARRVAQMLIEALGV